MPEFVDSIEVPLLKLAGVRPTTLSYELVGDDVANDAGALQDAIDSIAASAKRNTLLIAGTDAAYNIEAQIVIPSNVYLVGDGNLSMFKRGANLPVGEAMFSIEGENCGLINIGIDGDVTTATGIDYASLTDPMADFLTANTSIWIRPGARNVLITGIKVIHTGGYAIAIDCRTGNIVDVQIIDNQFENCRPTKAGPVGDENYGTWNGGILAQSDGALYGCTGLKVNYNRFRRMTGNCIWGHSYAFGAFHRNVEIIGNKMDVYALDAIQPGDMANVTVSNNSMNRGGFLHSTDNDAPVPLVNPNTYSVALDSTGFVQGFTYSNNTITQHNGGAIDLDGCFDGVVEGNNCSNALPGDVLYTLDSVASFGPTKGIQTGNSYHPAAARNIKICNNTIINFNVNAISLKNAKHCSISGNNIYHPSTAAGYPILIFNIATPGGSGTAEQRSHTNDIKGNRISYSGALQAIAEIEDVGAGPHLWQATDVNRVHDNTILGTGHFGEFKKAASSGSAARTSLPTNDPTVSGLAQLSQSYIQREGFGATAALKFYAETAAGSVQVGQLSDSAFLNISLAGGAGTGAIATGNRSALGFDDAIATSVIVADGFAAFAATTFSATKANALNANWVLLRRKPSANTLEVSTTIDTTDPMNPVRIWTDLSAGGSPGGPDTAIQFNNAGVFGGVAEHTWDNTLKRLSVTGLTGTAGVFVLDAFVQSEEGFYTPSTQFNAVQAPAGGVYGKQLTMAVNGLHMQDTVAGFEMSWPLIGLYNSGVGNHAPFYHPPWVKSNAYNAIQVFDCDTNNPPISITWGGIDLGRVTFEELGSAQAGAAAKSIIYMRAGKLKAVEGAGSEVDLIGVTSVGGADTNVQFNDGGIFGGSANFTYDKTLRRLTVSGLTGTASIVAGTSFIQSAEGFLTLDSSPDAVNVPLGGVTALALISVRNDGASGLTLVRTAGTARTYGFGIDAAGDLLIVDQSVGTRLSISTAGLVNVAVNLYVAGVGAGSAAITVNSGFVDAAHGFHTAGTSYQSIQAPSGGLFARSVHSNIYTDVGQSAGTPTATTGASFRAGNLYWDTSLPGYRYFNGSVWGALPLGAPGGSDTHVQYNAGGAFGGSANFIWNNGSRQLTVTGNTGTASIIAATSFIQSAEGFLTMDNSSDAINVPLGGVTALSHVAIRNDGAAGFTLSRTAATVRTWGLGIDSSGTLFIIDASVGNRLTINTSGVVTVGVSMIVGGVGSGSAGITLSNGFVDSAHGFFTGNTSYQSVQAPNGGMYARSHHSLVYTDLGQSASDPTATSGATHRAGTVYWSTSLGMHRVFNGSSWVPLSGGAVAGSNTQVQFNNSGAFGASSNFTWNNGLQQLTVLGIAGTAGIAVGTAYIQSGGGFFTTSSAYNAVNVPSGGVLAGRQLLAGPFTSDPGTSASSPFHAMSNGQCLYIADGYAGNVTGVIGRSARGSYAFPSATGFDDQIMSMGGRGHDGSGFVSSANAAVQFYATESYGPSNQGAEIRFATTANGVGAAVSFRRTRASIAHNGEFRLHNSAGTAVAGFRWSGSQLEFSNNLSSWSAIGGGGGVTSVNTAGNGITVSPTFGAVFVGLSTTANVILNALQLDSGATNALNLPNGFIRAQGLTCHTSTAPNSIQGPGGISMSGPAVFGGTVTCSGVLAGSNGIQGSGFNPFIAGVQYFGRTGSFQDLGGNTWQVRGGIITTA